MKQKLADGLSIAAYAITVGCVLFAICAVAWGIDTFMNSEAQKDWDKTCQSLNGRLVDTANGRYCVDSAGHPMRL